MPPLPAALAGASAAAAAWADDVDDLLGRPGPDTAYVALRAVLHVFHQVLDPTSAAALSGALPTVLRGVFHEPTVAAVLPALPTIASATRHAVRPEEAVRATCAVLARRTPEAWATVLPALPEPLASLLAVPPRPDRPAHAPQPCPNQSPTTSGRPRPVASAAARSALSTRRRPASS